MACAVFTPLKRASLCALAILAALAPAAPAEARPAGPVAGPPPACTQSWWTGTWKRLEHEGDAIFVQSGRAISSGRYTWAGGGSFADLELSRDCLTMTGLSPKTARLAAAAIEITLVRQGAFTGHWRWLTTPAGTWDGTFGGYCTAGACLVRKAVPIETVSNGCGGAGWDSLVAAQNYAGDTSAYVDSNVNPTARSVTVNFREACNLHDACYGGELVPDVVRGGTRDFRAWSRRDCDLKFLVDMRLLCERRIPSGWTVALANCKATGGNASFGAESRFNFVRKWGYLFFDADSTKLGTQKTGSRPNA